jgi:hypothetical protein
VWIHSKEYCKTGNLQFESTREQVIPDVVGIRAHLDGLHLLDVLVAVRINDLLPGHSITEVLEFVIRSNLGGRALDNIKIPIDVRIDSIIVRGRLPLDGMSVDYAGLDSDTARTTCEDGD